MKYHKRKGLQRSVLENSAVLRFREHGCFIHTLFQRGDETQGFLSTHMEPQTNKTLFQEDKMFENENTNGFFPTDDKIDLGSEGRFYRLSRFQ